MKRAISVYLEQCPGGLVGRSGFSKISPSSIQCLCSAGCGSSLCLAKKLVDLDVCDYIPASTIGRPGIEGSGPFEDATTGRVVLHG
jgi:hypothetical protein